MVPESVHLLNKSWVGKSFHSPFSTHSWGVRILVYKNVPFHCEQSLIDNEVCKRFLCLVCFSNRIFPLYSVLTLHSVLPFILAHPTLSFLLMGELNRYLNSFLVKYSGAHAGGEMWGHGSR